MNTDTLPPVKHLNKRSKANRRKDNDIRAAIDSVQKLLFNPQAEEKLFPVILKHLTAITDSDDGAIITIDNNQFHKAIYPEHRQPTIDLACVNYWIQQEFISLLPVFFNQPIPSQHAKLLVEPDNTSAMMVLPIVNENDVKATIILTKKQGDYSGELIMRLMPVLGSIICTLQVADSVSCELPSLDQVVFDNDFISTLFTSSPHAVLIVNDNKQVVLSNPAARSMFYPAAKDCDLNVFDLNPFIKPTSTGNSRTIDSFIPNFDDFFTWSLQHSKYGHQHPQMFSRIWKEQKAQREDGHQFFVNISVFRLSHDSQHFTVLQLEKNNHRIRAAENYQQTSQQLNALMHILPVAIIHVDLRWECVYANEKWYEFSGLSKEETLKEGWVDALDSKNIDDVLTQLMAALQRGERFHTELKIVSPLGQSRWVDFDTQVLYNRNGAIQGFLGTFTDITEQLNYNDRLRHAAEYDMLTGLANRGLFQNRLQQAFYLSERDGLDINIVFIDLDDFKVINDTLGHNTGDTLLKHLSRRLRSTLRRSDTIARFGGDEFVILLAPIEKPKDLAYIADKIVNNIAQPYTIDERSVTVTASVGIATGNYQNSSPEQLLKKADAALYLAKEKGKNNAQQFNSDLDEKDQQRIQLTHQLRTALEKQQFSLLFKPYATTDNQHIIGCEVLLQFKNDNNEIVSPDDFMPLLEQTGMISDVGQWMLSEACRQFQLWQEQQLLGDNSFLCVKLSCKQMLDKSTVAMVQQALQYYQIQAHQLILETTENLVIDNPEQMKSVMNALKAIGVRLALDDFGTGYSSLSYLQQCPVDQVKIDPSFIHNLLTDHNNAKIARAIITLCRSMDIQVTAQGVTNTNLLQQLVNYGADYFQGGLLGQAVTAKCFTQQLQSEFK